MVLFFSLKFDMLKKRKRKRTNPNYCNDEKKKWGNKTRVKQGEKDKMWFEI